MQSVSGFSQRFIPAAEFDADLGRLPVDDSCVISVPFSDQEEMRAWQQEQNERFDSEPPVDFDEQFGAQMQQHAAGEDPTPKPTPSAALALDKWRDALLVHLVWLADQAADEHLCDLATAELLKRMRLSIAA